MIAGAGSPGGMCREAVLGAGGMCREAVLGAGGLLRIARVAFASGDVGAMGEMGATSEAGGAARDRRVSWCETTPSSSDRLASRITVISGGRSMTTVLYAICRGSRGSWVVFFISSLMPVVSLHQAKCNHLLPAPGTSAGRIKTADQATIILFPVNRSPIQIRDFVRAHFA